MSRESTIAVVCLGVVLSVACATTIRHAPDTPIVTSPQSPGGDSEVVRRPWRPRHQGGADLATGLYIREDDDLVAVQARDVLEFEQRLLGDRLTGLWSRCEGLCCHEDVSTWTTMV